MPLPPRVCGGGGKRLRSERGRCLGRGHSVCRDDARGPPSMAGGERVGGGSSLDLRRRRACLPAAASGAARRCTQDTARPELAPGSALTVRLGPRGPHPARTRTRTHAHTYAHTHAHTRTLTLRHSHACTHAHAHRWTHMHTRTCMHTHMHTLILRHTHAHTYTLVHTRTHTHTCTHTCTHSHAHTLRHTRTHTQMHAHMHTYASLSSPPERISRGCLRVLTSSRKPSSRQARADVPALSPHCRRGACCRPCRSQAAGSSDWAGFLITRADGQSDLTVTRVPWSPHPITCARLHVFILHR